MFAKFPDGTKVQSYLGGPTIELHCGKQYSGIATFIHPDGRREDFFWNGTKYDGHSMECCPPKKAKVKRATSHNNRRQTLKRSAVR